MSWRVPAREEIFPLSEQQSCAVCGSPDCSWLLLLLHAPEWVQNRGWFANWFIAFCDDCHDAWRLDDIAALRARWVLDDGHLPGGGGPDLQEYLDVVRAMQTEPPLPRAAVPIE